MHSAIDIAVVPAAVQPVAVMSADGGHVVVGDRAGVRIAGGRC